MSAQSKKPPSKAAVQGMRPTDNTNTQTDMLRQACPCIFAGKKLSKIQSSSNKLVRLVALRAQRLCSVVGIQSPRLAFRAQGWHSEPKVGLQSRGATNWQVAGVAECCLPRQWRRPELTLDTLFPHTLRGGTQGPRMYSLIMRKVTCIL